MHVTDIFAQHSTTFSFEFYPPRSSDAWGLLFERIREFKALRPSFVSVTYGAGGSTRDRTIELVGRIKRELGIEPMAHLTCVQATRDELAAVLDRAAVRPLVRLVAVFFLAGLEALVLRLDRVTGRLCGWRWLLPIFLPMPRSGLR